MDLRLQILLILQFRTLLCLWRGPEMEPFRIYTDDDEGLTFPKPHHTDLKILDPVIDDKFYAQLLKPSKKFPKYPKLASRLGPGLDVVGVKKCCANGWALEGEGLEGLFRPVSLVGTLPLHQVHRGHAEDVKPVTEHIEDDLKYDFRTKTHSFR